MERVQGFDIARGMGVVLVVGLHATLLPQYGAALPQPICRMALLMVISGAVAAPSLRRSWTYSRDRGLDLLWLFALWTPITLIGIDGFAALVTLPHELAAPNSHLWYIGCLGLLVMTMPLVRRASPAIPLSVSGLAAALYLAGFRTGVLGYDQPIHFTFFFYAGLYGRQRLLTILMRCGSLAGWLAGVAAATMPLLPLPHTFLTLAEAAMLLVAAQALSGSRAGPPLIWLGRRTPEIYLAHMPLLFLCGRAVGPMGTVALTLLAISVIALCLTLRTLADVMGLDWLYRRPRFAIIDDGLRIRSIEMQGILR